MKTLPGDQSATGGDPGLYPIVGRVRRLVALAGAARTLAGTVMAAVVVAGCAAQKTPVPDAPSLAARVYTARCSACHSLPSPKRLYYRQWKHMLGVMDKNMAHRGMQPLTGEDKREILAYLKANAR